MRPNSLIALARPGTPRETSELSGGCVKSGSHRTTLERRRSLFISPGIIAFGAIF